MAGLAGIQARIDVASEHIQVSFHSYNDSIESYFSEVFRHIQQFTVNETFFNDLCEATLRGWKNTLTAEPYQRLGLLSNIALYGDPTIQEKIDILMDIDFEKFMDFKSKFFRNLKYKWFIFGHLNQERALKIFETAQSSITLNTTISEDDVKIYQMVKLPSKSVHNLN